MDNDAPDVLIRSTESPDLFDLTGAASGQIGVTFNGSFTANLPIQDRQEVYCQIKADVGGIIYRSNVIPVTMVESIF